MSALLISYDLGNHSGDYEALREAIEAYGSAVRPLESVWIIVTDEEIHNVVSKLAQKIRDKDRLLVMKLGLGWCSSNLDRQVVKWMQANVAA
jgi:hypothetical protein